MRARAKRADPALRRPPYASALTDLLLVVSAAVRAAAMEYVGAQVAKCFPVSR